MQYRRRAPRVQIPGWPGKYVVEDDPEGGWNECRLLDVSLLGLGVELLGPVSRDLVGRRLVVHVEVEGGSVSVRLVGTVRRLSARDVGWTRAGLEFDGLSETERSILKVIEDLKVGW